MRKTEQLEVLVAFGPSSDCHGSPLYIYITSHHPSLHVSWNMVLPFVMTPPPFSSTIPYEFPGPARSSSCRTSSKRSLHGVDCIDIVQTWHQSRPMGNTSCRMQILASGRLRLSMEYVNRLPFLMCPSTSMLCMTVSQSRPL